MLVVRDFELREGTQLKSELRTHCGRQSRARRLQELSARPGGEMVLGRTSRSLYYCEKARLYYLDYSSFAERPLRYIRKKR